MTHSPSSKLPVVQVALDFLNLERALGCAREAVAGGAARIEAGTPLIKSEGLDAVRTLRAEFPGLPIVADMKIMDTGRIEMEAAAKAGAGIAMVLGVASDSTIRECVEAGRNYGIAVAVDLIGTRDPVARARECAALGVAEVHVHLSIDDQMQGQKQDQTQAKAHIDILREVRSAVEVPVAAVGGLHQGNVVEAAEAGADVLVIGGAITKSTDARAATEGIIQALATGVAESPERFRRGGASDVREILSGVSAANVSDAMHRGGVLEGLRSLAPGLRMVGQAVTVRTYPGDWAKPVEAIDLAKSGDVIVIDAGGVPLAVWGELATESAKRKDIAGVVIDGAARDTGEIRALGLPLFARHFCPNAGEPKGFGETGVPVRIGGRTVSPGDWIVGDDDGVVAVPAARAVEIANRAQDVLERENRIREEMRRGSTLAEVVELLRWEKK